MPQPEQLTPAEAADAFAAVEQIIPLLEDLQSAIRRMAAAASRLPIVAADTAYSGDERDLTRVQSAAATDALMGLALVNLLIQRLAVARDALAHSLTAAENAEFAAEHFAEA